MNNDATVAGPEVQTIAGPVPATGIHICIRARVRIRVSVTQTSV